MHALKKIGEFLRDESGPTAVEYAVMLMLVLLAVLATIQVLGESTRDSFADSRDKIEAATGGP